MCYITNAVHYRPPFNRTPHPYEVIASLPLLEEEAAAVLPQVIVALGAVALRALAYRLPPPALGEMVSWQFPAWHRVMLLPLRHPSWVLREGPAAEDEMREGLRKIIGG
jgi:uracil-DNA glycosylase family 4